MESELDKGEERLAALIKLEDILGHLVESGRINWTRDDAPIIHAALEDAQAAISDED